MKLKSFFFFSVILLAYLIIGPLGANALKEIFRPQHLERNSWIFADPNYTQPTVNFLPGEWIYLKIETFNDGERQRTVKLLNYKKEVLSTFTLNKEGINPFTYTLSFQLPNEEGIFYLHLDIKSSGGSVYTAESNINIGKTSGTARSVATAEINTQSDDQTQIETETFTNQSENLEDESNLIPEEVEGDQPAIFLTPTPPCNLPPKQNDYLTGSIKELLNAYASFLRNFINFFKNLLNF